MLCKTSLASLAVAALAVAVPAAAQSLQAATQDLPPIIVVGQLRPSPDMIVRTVSIGDLDLKSVAGKQEMEKRVSAAVDSMCSMPAPIPSYGPVMEKPCRDEAWASARPQMDAAVQRAGGGS
jgi:UrcA family protein